MVICSQYIEDGELDRVWKASRRQRAKDQEQRIWEDFVKEKDIVHNACTGVYNWLCIVYYSIYTIHKNVYVDIPSSNITI